MSESYKKLYKVKRNFNFTVDLASILYNCSVIFHGPYQKFEYINKWNTKLVNINSKSSTMTSVQFLWTVFIVFIGGFEQASSLRCSFVISFHSHSVLRFSKSQTAIAIFGNMITLSIKAWDFYFTCTNHLAKVTFLQKGNFACCSCMVAFTRVMLSKFLQSFFPYPKAFCKTNFLLIAFCLEFTFFSFHSYIYDALRFLVSFYTILKTWITPMDECYF